MPDNFASLENGLVVICNGIDPVAIWRGDESTIENAGLIAPTTAVTGVGDGAGAMTGSYFAYVSYIRNDGLESSMSPVSATIILNNHLEIDYSSIPVSPDSRVVARRIWRNTNGQARTVYLDVQIDDNVATTASSSLSDSILQAGTAFPLFDDRNILRTLNGNPPPDTKPFVCLHLGRAYYYGHADYSEGSCEVTLGSTVIQGRGTRWRANWATRLIYVDGSDLPYEIESVDVDLQQITLTEPYGSATNLFAAYTVRPTPAECATLYYSEVNDPERVSPFNALAVPEEDDPGTGLISMYGFLYILKRQSIYRFTVGRDPRLDGAIYPANNRGCINQRCVVVVADTAFILDERGAYIFSGGQDLQDLTAPIQDIFRDGAESPINWNCGRYFHAAHSPGESTIRWFVNFRGDYQPRHALAFCYTLQRWWMDMHDRPVGASALGLSGRVATGWGRAQEQAYYGLDAGQIVAPSRAMPELAERPAATTAKVLSSTFTTVTIDQAATPDLVGSSVVIRPRGAGKIQSRRIVAVSGQTITVNPPWAQMPEEEDDAIPGGFIWQFQTHDLRFNSKETTDERSAEIFFEPNPGSMMDIVIQQNSADDISAANIAGTANAGVEYRANRPAKRADIGHDDGSATVRYDGLLEGMTAGRKRMNITLTGVGGNAQDAIQQVILKGVTA
jgi:hypothetical protein